MCRWLCEMLFRFQFSKLQLHSLLKTLTEYIAFLIIFFLHVHRHKSVKYDLGGSNRKSILSCTDFYWCCFIFCCRHTACCKAFPDQLIQTELISGKRFFDHDWRSGNISRTDCFMRILNLLVFFYHLSTCRNIVFSILFTNIGSRCFICFLWDTSGIRTQITDQTNRAASLNINTFI